MERRLQIDIPGSVAALRAAVHYFELRTKIYRFLFQSRGFEFDGYRSYAAEDDASAIDWMASKRAGEPIVRQYREELDRKIILLIDVGGSMVFGSGQKLKCEYIAEIAAALAHLIITYNDRIGYILFNDKVVHYNTPSKGLSDFYNLMDILQMPSLYEGTSRLDSALEFLLRYFTKNVAAVFIISDFLRVTKDTERFLQYTSEKFETIALMVKDPRDISLPDISSEVVLENPADGTQLIVNPGLAQEHYERLAREQESSVLRLFYSTNINTLQLLTTIPFALPLAEFLKERIRRR